MSYVTRDFASKRELKSAVSQLNGNPPAQLARFLRHELSIMQTSIIPSVDDASPPDGIAYLEGPHFPKPHKWYARVHVTDGVVDRVIS